MKGLDCQDAELPSSERLWDTTEDFMQGSDMTGFAF